ncbi:hypothetical protein RRF57_000696 [Xylaria bambusicola]|uniref:2EXR domain-containing protein n=1 Tax=Xylaria bambusicola TaxID=326684 RepID=A0AAN7YUD8_9PEZI
MNTFHLFLQLPAEVRLLIWEATLVPRVVRVGFGRLYIDEKALCLRSRLMSPTPIPAILHTCKESRYHSPYQKAFSELDDIDDGEPRYIWVNFTVDVIDVGYLVDILAPVAPLIQKLRFMPPYLSRITDEDLDTLRKFINIREIQIGWQAYLFDDPFGMKDVDWPCGVDNVFVMVGDDDGVKRLVDITEEDLT